MCYLIQLDQGSVYFGNLSPSWRYVFSILGKGFEVYAENTGLDLMFWYLAPSGLGQEGGGENTRRKMRKLIEGGAAEVTDGSMIGRRCSLF